MARHYKQLQCVILPIMLQQYSLEIEQARVVECRFGGLLKWLTTTSITRCPVSGPSWGYIVINPRLGVGDICQDTQGQILQRLGQQWR